MDLIRLEKRPSSGGWAVKFSRQNFYRPSSEKTEDEPKTRSTGSGLLITPTNDGIMLTTLQKPLIH